MDSFKAANYFNKGESMDSFNKGESMDSFKAANYVELSALISIMTNICNCMELMICKLHLSLIP